MPKNSFVIVNADGTTTPTEKFDGLTVTFRGSNSTVEIAEGAVFNNCRFTLGSNARISIGKTHHRGLRNVVVNLTGRGEGRTLTIGAGTSIEGCRFSMAGDGPRVVTIGADCMMSSGITFRPSDGHAIFDLDTGNVINHARPIVLGDHVWVGADVTFLKGGTVPDDTIVGTRSLVSRRFEEPNTAIAGAPAKIVRRRVGWDRAHVEDYAERSQAPRERVTIEIDPELECDPGDFIDEAARIANQRAKVTNMRFVERVRWDDRREKLGDEPFDYLVFEGETLRR